MFQGMVEAEHLMKLINSMKKLLFVCIRFFTSEKLKMHLYLSYIITIMNITKDIET